MAEPVPSPELLRALGKLLRGLSLLVWGLPIGLVICVHTGLKNRLESHSWDFIAPSVITGLVFYGTWQLGAFHKQERIWIAAVERLRMLSLAIFGLSPFLFWRVEVPDAAAFHFAVLLFAALGLLLLYSINHVLLRLVMMLPDEGLRQETRQFATLNQYLLMAIPICMLLYTMLLALVQAGKLPEKLADFIYRSQDINQWFFLLLFLMPLAITLALIWKIREVVYQSIFGDQHIRE